MSIHPSLRGVDTLAGERSVFTRMERLQKLIKERKLTPQDSPYGLPKVRTSLKVVSARRAKALAGQESAKPEGAEG